MSDEPMQRDDAFDYYEVVIAHCKMPGCEWERHIDWSDLEVKDGVSPARAAFNEHWVQTHAQSDVEGV